MLDSIDFSELKNAADLFKQVEVALGLTANGGSDYYDRKSGLTCEEYTEALKNSTTLYVGNLNPNQTFELPLWSYFSQLAPCQSLERVIIGVNRKTFYPCGFCFLEFTDRNAAAMVQGIMHSMPWIQTKKNNNNQTHLKSERTNNENITSNCLLSVDWDYGFTSGRQWGRGRRGGQVADERNEREFNEDDSFKENYDEENEKKTNYKNNNNNLGKRNYNQRDNITCENDDNDYQRNNRYKNNRSNYNSSSYQNKRFKQNNNDSWSSNNNSNSYKADQDKSYTNNNDFSNSNDDWASTNNNDKTTTLQAGNGWDEPIQSSKVQEDQPNNIISKQITNQSINNSNNNNNDNGWDDKPQQLETNKQKDDGWD